MHKGEKRRMRRVDMTINEQNMVESMTLKVIGGGTDTKMVYYDLRSDPSWVCSCPARKECRHVKMGKWIINMVADGADRMLNYDVKRDDGKPESKVDFSEKLAEALNA